ncbi:unnamed protein product [Camellia sinensis]
MSSSMTKKKRSSSSYLSGRRLFSVGSKLVIWLAAILCFVALVRLHSESTIIITDFHKFRTFNHHFQGSPKVAFLFLTRGALPLDFLWHTFFQNGDVANFSIYIHSRPGFVFNEKTTRSAFFHDREVRNSIQVTWGEPTMIEAERLLLEAALEEPANQRFVLLSDSCVPLYNFRYIYNYLMSSPRSFVDSFLDAKEVRYNPKMSPIIPKHKWRKGSQWITLIREHAEVVVNDNIVLPVFKKFCRRLRWRPFAGLGKAGELFSRLLGLYNCIPDEHYMQTLLLMRDLEVELERRSLTYSLWNQFVGKEDRNSWHPITFQYADAGPQQIKEIKDIDHVKYESEDRIEWCRTNSTSAPCFLFARKFSPGAAMRLLTSGEIGLFDVATLLDTPI